MTSESIMLSKTHREGNKIMVTLFLTNDDTSRRAASVKARTHARPGEHLLYCGSIPAAGGTIHVYHAL